MAYQRCGAQSGPVPHRLSSDQWIQAQERLGPGLESPYTTPATTAPSAAREMLHAFGRGGHPSCNQRLYSSPWPCPTRLARRGGLTPGLAPREPSRASGPPQVAPTGRRALAVDPVDPVDPVDRTVDHCRPSVDHPPVDLLSTAVDPCRPKVDSKHACPLSTAVDFAVDRCRLSRPVAAKSRGHQTRPSEVPSGCHAFRHHP